MKVTEIRVKLLPGQKDKLRAFASITVDSSLVVRDIKIIEGSKGLFIAMPSRKMCDRCPQCAAKNSVRARYCNDCGSKLADNRSALDERGRPRLYADIAHPINQESREAVQNSVLAAYHEEFKRSKQAGYKAVKFDDMDYEFTADLG